MHVRVNNRGNNSHCAPPASCISLPCCLPLNPQQQPSFLSPLAVGLFLSSFFCGSEKRTRELCVGENQKEKGTDKFSSARPAFLSSHHGPQIRHWPQNRTSPSATTKKESGKTKREEFAPSSFIQSKHKHPFFLSFPFLSSPSLPFPSLPFPPPLLLTFTITCDSTLEPRSKKQKKKNKTQKHKNKNGNGGICVAKEQA